MLSLLTVCLAIAASAAWLMGRAGAVRANAAMTAALAAQGSTQRLLRLSAGDQRDVALTLFGHAQAADPIDAALTALARRLLDMSEDLIQQTETPVAERRLAEADMLLMPVVEFAMAQVAAHLGPSRRAWRIDEAFEDIRLFADRRALNQVLVNVLSGAAAATRNGDWIELSALPGRDEWSIVVQDEGIGIPVGDGDTHPGESRGIGLRLTLARSLMHAHGGSLIVESTERVGTRVRLGLPNSRVLED